MTKTAGDALTSARVTLNDAAKRRVSDATGLSLVVDALNEIRNVRPDLFVGSSWGAIDSIAAADPLPIPSQFFRPIVDYVIARVETADDEAVNSARAQLMASLVGGFLK